MPNNALFFDIVAWLWIALWAYLIFHCVKRKSTPGVLGGKATWLCMLLLADPLMSLMYATFVVLKVGQNKRWVNWVVVLGLLTVLPGWMGQLGTMGNRTFERDAHGRWDLPDPFSVKASVAISHQSMQSSSFKHDDHATAVEPRRVEILIDGEEPIVSEAAVSLADKLSTIASIETIDLVRIGTQISGKRAPDWRIRLRVHETCRFSKWFRLSPWSLVPSELRFHFEVTPYTTNVHGTYARPSIRLRPEMDFKGLSKHVSYGLEYPRLYQEARKMVKVPSDTFLEIFQELQANCPKAEAFPEACFGTYQAPPKFDFLERLGARMVIAESDLLLHSNVAWSFVMPSWNELERLRTEIQQAGFDDPFLGSESQTTTTGRRGNEWVGLKPTYEFLAATHWSRDDGTSGIIPPEIAGVEFTFQYQRYFTQPEIEAATEAITALNNPGLLKAWLAEPAVQGKVR